MWKMLGWVGLSCWVAVLLAGCSTPVEEGECPKSKHPKILVDLYHTRLQNHVDYRLKKGEYNYQGVFGYHRAFKHLEKQGYQIDVFRNKPVTSICLDGYDTLFINLLHEKMPVISAEEQKAITAYVKAGGGLVIIADHTNVYRHAERLNPMLKPMGIEILFGTIADSPPTYSVEGSGWIKVLDFRKHPVTEGVKMISLQTGTAFQAKAGVAYSSKDSFSDFWDETDQHGFYGDWKYNGDPKKEPKGPLPVVVAAEYGKGRVVVAGDQNMFGDTWLHFGDNFRLFMNTFAWTTKREAQKPHPGEVKPAGYNIGIDISHGPAWPGRSSGDGYYSFFAHLNRDEGISASALSGFSSQVDAWFSIRPEKAYSPSEIREIASLLDAGKRVVLFLEPGEVTTAMRDLLVTLAPSFSIEANGKDYLLKDTSAWKTFQSLKLPQVKGSIFRVESTFLKSDGLEISSVNGLFPSQPLESRRYLFDIRSSWGKSFLSVSYQKRRMDLARVRKVSKGELIIFLQDGFWQNRTIGHRATEQPPNENKDAVTLLYAFLDYLKGSSR